jgi:TraM recognition site of TraD and TraG
MDSLQFQLDHWGIAAMRWATPWWWITTGACLGALAVLNILPLRVPPSKEHEYGFSDVAKIGLRQLCLTALGLLVLVFWPALYMLTVSSLASTGAAGHAWFVDFLRRQAVAWGWLLPVCFALGVGARMGWGRYGAPYLSKLVQRRLVRQEDHARSDIRQDVGKLKPRDFNPREHYREGEVFLGLDNSNQPTYLPAKVFRETHMQVVGPTRFGKGVLLGVMLEQAVLAGNAVVYIDPKADKFLPFILADACEKVGKRFVYIDLNSEDTRWAPFEGGGERDRRSRIVNCFGLNNTGDGSDFYKSKERAILDTILPKCGSSIAGLRAALEQRGEDGKPLKENANRLYDGLTEFSVVPALNPKKGGGNKIGEALKAGACVYVKGSLDDPTIKRASQVLLTEVLQEARRLGPERTSHLTLAIDELKFMISQEVSDALATIAGFNVNMILLHQSIRDLRSPEDRSLNVQALESGVIVNCQVKLMYRASDPETAEWASKLSGTKMVRVTKSQTVEHNRHGGEAYKRERMLTDVEVPIITQNEMLSLSPRVGVFFVPERLATVIFTCFVSANTQRVLYQRPQEKAAAQQLPAPTAPAAKAEPTPREQTATAAVAAPSPASAPRPQAAKHPPKPNSKTKPPQTRPQPAPEPAPQAAAPLAPTPAPADTAAADTPSPQEAVA